MKNDILLPRGSLLILGKRAYDETKFNISCLITFNFIYFVRRNYIDISTYVCSTWIS